METKVTLFQLLISSGGVIAAIITAWVHMRINVASLKTEMAYIKKELESEKEGNKENYKLLYGKIDNIFKAINEIKISIVEKK